ncbi:UNVERIFIED_CONTAM: hypothetical protein Slati_2357700 [Sesamum latifolium]|uniref:Uncharacterized protein n=1 Tax=Sesamum latifolium TaxID=2727402 RepID=A0AAW2WAC2_9LAMI
MQFYSNGSLVVLVGDSPASVSLTSFPQFMRLLACDAVASVHAVSMLPIDIDSLNSPPSSGPVSAPDASLPADLAALLRHFEAVFALPQGLPPHRPHDHRIHLVPNASPVNSRPYCYPHCQKEVISFLITEMLRDGLICPVPVPIRLRSF